MGTATITRKSQGGLERVRDSQAVSYLQRAARFMRGVLDGSIPACKWVKLACQRQVDDLARARRGDFDYKFSEYHAEHVCKFVERSPHVKGKRFVGQTIHLEDWQCFVLTTVFGWVTADDLQLRRFRRAYSEVAKGNGKSAMSSAISNYMAFADKEPGAEVYSAATTRDQAKIVWSVSHSMLKAMPGFCEQMGVEPAAHAIYQPHTNSFFKPLSSEANSVEGINPYFICVDELHAHQNRELYDNLDTANGKREGSMLWIITTAGDDQAGICYEVRTYITKILDKQVDDDSQFGIIFTIDDKDDWAAGPQVWRKANPNWGISVDTADFQRKINKALAMASARPGTQTKHLNIWVNASFSWMDMIRWRQCEDPSMRLEDFTGKFCVLGLDLSSNFDILAKVKIFFDDRGTEITDPETGEKVTRVMRHYWIFGDYWTPQARIEKTQNAQYKGWAIDNWLHTCPGETNDFDVVEQSIKEDAKNYRILEVAHDPFMAQQFVNHLMPEDAPHIVEMVRIDQWAKFLSPAMSEVEAAVFDGRLHHNGDPIMAWAISNVVTKVDKNNLMFPDKSRPGKKIDPATALFNGIARAKEQPPTTEEVIGCGVYDKCARCSKFTEGVSIKGVIVFDCGAHASS